MHKLLYAGKYNPDPEKEGLSIFWFDSTSGTLEPAGTGARMRNVSFAAIHGDILYAVDEEKIREGYRKDAIVSAFRIDRKNGSLRHMSTVRFDGSAACHVTVWPGGKYISCGCYMSGSVVVLPAAGGVLAQPAAMAVISSDDRRIDGKSTISHIHSTIVSPDRKRLFAADKGADRVHVYRVGTASGDMTADCADNQIILPEGEGPRHMVFSPDGRFLYLLTEMGSKCFVYSYDPAAGRTKHILTVSLLPEAVGETKCMAADIHFSPDGRFLYCSNRGIDTIAVFAVDSEKGLLVPVWQEPLHGSHCRSFAVCEDYVIMAFQESGNLLVCRRDRETGRIGDMTDCINIMAPAFVLMDE